MIVLSFAIFCMCSMVNPVDSFVCATGLVSPECENPRWTSLSDLRDKDDDDEVLPSSSSKPTLLIASPDDDDDVADVSFIIKITNNITNALVPIVLLIDLNRKEEEHDDADFDDFDENNVATIVVVIERGRRRS